MPVILVSPLSTADPLTLDLQRRLSGLGVPVLAAEDRELPAAGRQPGQVGGLVKYLSDHPQGYVQLNLPAGLLSFDVRSLSLLQLDAVGPGHGAVLGLLTGIKAALHATAYRPTPYHLFGDARYDPPVPGIWRASLTFQLTSKIPNGGTP